MESREWETAAAAAAPDRRAASPAARTARPPSSPCGASRRCGRIGHDLSTARQRGSGLPLVPDRVRPVRRGCRDRPGPRPRRRVRRPRAAKRAHDHAHRGDASPRRSRVWQPGAGPEDGRPHPPPSRRRRGLRPRPHRGGERDPSRQRCPAGLAHARPYAGERQPRRQRSRPGRRAVVRADRGHPLHWRRGPARLRRRAGRRRPLPEPRGQAARPPGQRRGVSGPRGGLGVRSGHVGQDDVHHRLRAPLQRCAASARRGNIRAPAHDRASPEAAELRPHHREEPRPDPPVPGRGARTVGGPGPGGRRQGRGRPRRARAGRLRRGPRARGHQRVDRESAVREPGGLVPARRPPGRPRGGRPQRSRPRRAGAVADRRRRDRRPPAVGHDGLAQPGAADGRGGADHGARAGHAPRGGADPRGDRRAGALRVGRGAHRGSAPPAHGRSREATRRDSRRPAQGRRSARAASARAR